jgi:hypothetical protein
MSECNDRRGGGGGARKENGKKYFKAWEGKVAADKSSLKRPGSTSVAC